jgi:oxygen-dependent protoporphyrinogen oxidase
VGRLDEEALLAVTREELARLLGLRGEPVYRHVVLWPRAIPQYEVGHVARVARIRNELERLPGLYIAGNGLDGIAYTRAAAAGAACADEAVAALAGTSAPASAAEPR